MSTYTVPIHKRVTEPESEEYKIERRTRLFLMDGTTIDTPLTMFQIESFIHSAGSGRGTPFLRTMTIDKSGKFHSELISYGFLARVTDLKAYA
jgi:hypothetical protein